MSGFPTDRCQACGRSASPWHDSSAPGPTVRHMFVPPEPPPTPDTVSELRSWLTARIDKDGARARRDMAEGLYGDASDAQARTEAFQDVLDHLNQLESHSPQDLASQDHP